MGYIEERNQKALTAGELIEQLKELDEFTPVWGAGCDCDNPIVGVTKPTGTGPADHALLEVDL